MVLSEDDAKLFYRLMWPLQFFVNQKLQLIPNCPTLETYKDLPAEQKLKVRDALYKKPSLIDEFVKENPEGFTEEELRIIQSWHKCIVGEFYIERYLAKHAILIKDDTVYSVLGLFDPLESSVPRELLPVYVKTVLLPFKGRIIYDGLFQPYQVYFGPGIKSGLRETYLTAKQNHRIIESLEADRHPTIELKPRKPAKDWNSKIETLLREAQELSAGTAAPAIYGPVFSLVKASLELAHSAVQNPDAVDELWDHTRKADRALRKVFTTLNRASGFRLGE
jgi:hypothetical protein